MLAILQQLPAGVWVAAILVLIVASSIVIWMRKRKFSVSKVKLTAGPIEAELTPASQDKSTSGAAPTTAPHQPESINISGNKLFWKNILRIRRQGTNISDNVLVGENEIEVGDKPGPKPKSQKEKGNQ
jgi:hypothetical protein